MSATVTTTQAIAELLPIVIKFNNDEPAPHWRIERVDEEELYVFCKNWSFTLTCLDDEADSGFSLYRLHFVWWTDLEEARYQAFEKEHIAAKIAALPEFLTSHSRDEIEEIVAAKEEIIDRSPRGDKKFVITTMDDFRNILDDIQSLITWGEGPLEMAQCGNIKQEIPVGEIPIKDWYDADDENWYETP